MRTSLNIRLTVGMVVGALLMVSASQLFAYGSLDYLYNSQVRTEHWENTANIPWYIDQVAYNKYYAATQASFDNWENVPYGDITFQYQGTTSQVWDADDGINVVSFNSGYVGWGGTLAFTVNYKIQSTGEIYGFDIIMNPKAKWSTDGTPRKREYEAEAVVTHEIGHAHGLAHVVVAQATMYPFISPGDVGPTTLEDDDFISQALLYGNASFPGPYSQFQGSVARGGTGNPVAGACVHSFPPDAQYYSDNITNTYTFSAGTYTLYVPAGDYLLRLDPLDGDPAAFDPSHISELLMAIAETDFPAEWYNDGESNCEDNTIATAYSISSGQVRTGFDFVTNENCGGGVDTIHVQSLTVTRTSRGPWRRGQATVHIVNQFGADVANATVTGYFNAPNTNSKSGTTGSDGNATITSDKTKNPPADWCFEVTDVSLSGAVYDPSKNVVTKACESGPVFRFGDAVASAVPHDFTLEQNYPNPFNPTTTIELYLPVASDWSIIIYNIVGQQVAEYNGHSEAGKVDVTWDASDQASGIYLYRATAGNFAQTRKMILLK